VPAPVGDDGPVTRLGDLVFGPVVDLMLDYGIRLELLVPLVAVLSMGIGILYSRFGGRSR
jgi:hypothetical protein